MAMSWRGRLALSFGLLLLGAGCGDDDGAQDAGVDAEAVDARPDVHIVRCGDGVREGNEECDDGNTEPGDGCNQFCQREARCGNGVREAGEECDGTDLATNCVLAGHLQGSVSCDGDCRAVLDGCLDEAEGLLAWYKLDTVANMVPDYSGKGYGCQPEALEGGYPGVVGEATLFDRGRGGHADCGTGDATAPWDGFEALTVEAWVRLNSYADLDSDFAAVISRNASGDPGDFVFVLGVAGVPYGETAHHALFAVGRPDAAVLGSAMLTTGTWVHLAGVFQGGSLSLYVNGSLDATATVDASALPTVPEARTYLGALHEGQNPVDVFDGYLDEVKVWTTARDAEQICADAGGFYEPGSDPPCRVPEFE